MTAADELRTAAQTLRRKAAQAEAAYPLPWIAGDDEDDTLPYIAAMHPGVGAALAELLETAAIYVPEGSPTHPTHLVRALVVARAVLGTTP